ncbi:hypothetical protein Q3G72_009717 [Acer saccharum]|nr:hypothetical protein Q3G72_009717 [Acer saccharum]
MTCFDTSANRNDVPIQFEFGPKMKYLSLHSIPATLLRELKAFKSGVAQLLHQECDRNIGRRKLCIGEKSD